MSLTPLQNKQQQSCSRILCFNKYNRMCNQNKQPNTSYKNVSSVKERDILAHRVYRLQTTHPATMPHLSRSEAGCAAHRVSTTDHTSCNNAPSVKELDRRCGSPRLLHQCPICHGVRQTVRPTVSPLRTTHPAPMPHSSRSETDCAVHRVSLTDQSVRRQTRVEKTARFNRRFELPITRTASANQNITKYCHQTDCTTHRVSTTDNTSCTNTPFIKE